MDYIECIYYINLAHREDRKTHMQTWLKETGVPESKIQRIDAVHRPDKGYIGCTESHIKALETFIESNHNVCCIYEDDYNPIDALSYWSNIQHIFKIGLPFDVILLSYNGLASIPSGHPHLEKVTYSQTTSGYCITKQYAQVLLKNFKESLGLALEAEKSYGKNSNYSCDIYWKSLMPIGNWYTYVPRLGLQMESFSDVEKRMTNYQC
jgi:hypothetical protein